MRVSTLLLSVACSVALAGCLNARDDNPFAVRSIEKIDRALVNDDIVVRDSDGRSWVNLSSTIEYKSPIRMSRACNVATAAADYASSRAEELRALVNNLEREREALIFFRDNSRRRQPPQTDVITMLDIKLGEIDVSIKGAEEEQQRIQSQIAVAQVDTLVNPAECMNARNSIISAYLNVSDDVCDRHLADTQFQSASTNLFLGTATSAASLAATVVGAGDGPRALAATAGLTNSMRSMTNEELYLQRIAPLITKQIRTERKKLRTRLTDGLMKSTAEYPVDMALADVKEYHGSCSFAVGLELIAQSDAKRGTISRDSISAAITEIDAEITKINTAISNRESAKLSDAAVAAMTRDRDLLNDRRNQLAIQRSNFLLVD